MHTNQGQKRACCCQLIALSYSLMHQLQGPKLTIYYCQGIASQEVEGELIQLEAPAKFFLQHYMVRVSIIYIHQTKLK
jgi:hypothetical protein